MKKIMLHKPAGIAVLFFSLFLLIRPAAVHAADKEQMKQLKVMEDSLMLAADSMFRTPIPDFRTEYCQQFVRQLIRTLKLPGSYSYRFDSLSRLINIISPEDGSFRIFNWAVAYSDVRLRYYAAIQMAGEELKLYPLYDNSEMLGKIEDDKVLSPKDWIGGLFYNIITRKSEGRNIYCLLGVNDGNPVSTKKFVDPMVFTENGPEFGADIFAIQSFSTPGTGAKRFVLEYKKGVQVSMNWDATYNAILFDDIASGINDPNRKYTYVPTGQYNGLRWAGDKWKLVTNLIPLLELKDGEAPSGESNR